MSMRLLEKVKKILRNYRDCLRSDVKVNASNHGGLLGLPVEIFDYILEFLPGPSVLALCVTSKVLYRTLSHVQQSLNSNLLDKKEFLWLLDRDTPHLLHCRGCNKLFKWTSTSRTFECPRRHDAQHLLPFVPHNSVGKSSRLSVEVRDLLLRYDEKGPEWGLPPSILGQLCPGWSCGPKRRTEIEAKVVDRMVIMRRVDTLLVDTARNIPDELALVGLSSPVMHGHTGGCLATFALLMLKQLLSCGTSANTARYTTHSVISPLLHCKECMTDVRIEASEVIGDRESVRLEVVWFHEFGNREHDVDKSYRLFRPRTCKPVSEDEVIERDIETQWFGYKNKRILASCVDSLSQVSIDAAYRSLPGHVYGYGWRGNDRLIQSWYGAEADWLQKLYYGEQ